MQNKIVVLDSLLTTTAANSPIFHHERFSEESGVTSGQLFRVLQPQPDIAVKNGEYLLIEAAALSPDLKEVHVFINDREVAELYPPYLFYSFNLHNNTEALTIKITAESDHKRQSTTMRLSVIEDDTRPARVVFSPTSIQFVDGYLYGADRGILIRLDANSIPEVSGDIDLFIDSKFLAELTRESYQHLWQACQPRLRKKAVNEQQKQRWLDTTIASNSVIDLLTIVARPNVKPKIPDQRLVMIPDNLSLLLQEIIALYQEQPKRQVKQLRNLDEIIIRSDSFFKPTTGSSIKHADRPIYLKASWHPLPASHNNIRKYSRNKDRKH